ncbi:MAG: glycosyltransferase [Verrucomicrobiota bacterium JB022]|nr:glycosyltransferase [Verrucomicrobiota bacterium JB022]
MSPAQPARAALVTLAIGKMPWLRHTEPWREAYAARHGLAYVRLTQPRVRKVVRWFKPRVNLYLEKFQLYDLFPQFERLLYVDADVILHPRAPNFLNLVPPDELGVVYEDLYHEEPKRLEEWERAQQRLGPLPKPPAGYFNAGVMVMGPHHRELFTTKGRKFASGRWPDQNTLNYYAVRDHYALRVLPAHCNLMPVAGEAFENDTLRRRAWAIHYAGRDKALMEGDDAYFREAYGRPIDFSRAAS